MKMKIEKVGRKEVREIEPGQTVCFVLPNYAAVESARVTVRQIELLEEKKFRTYSGNYKTELNVERVR